MVNKTKINIMFVCMGNICRSPLAHAVFEKMVQDQGLGDRFHIESAGTINYHAGEPADPRMRATAAQHGVIVDHRANHLSPADLDTYDIILAMDRDNLSNIRALVQQPEQLEKIRLFREFDPEGGPNAEVPDPYYGGPAGFEQVYQMVERTSRALLDELTRA